ncbi:MAG: TonB-dependent receptor [Bacteroidia bacterium]|nr:TonB-dependent receptor [Bacteroidia bacterium]NNK27493.1 TonB-dependent receptor [Flavobacteriaceae bacterium]
MKSITYILLFFCIIAYSQNRSIKGTITSAPNNQSIEFASIYLPELERGTMTEEDGMFQIENLPSGVFKLVVSYIGYETISISVNTEENIDLEIALNPSIIEMEAVIVSTPFHQLQRDNVMKVERQTVEDLRNQGAINLSEGITNIAGVESITTGATIGKPVIRGLSANRVLVYTQGIRLENQQFGDEHGLGLSDSGIESVEVIKGPASLLYGSDALGGVLYFNPERFAQSNESAGDVLATYISNTNGISTNAGFKTSGEKIKFLIRGGLSEQADYDTEDFRVTNSRSKEYDIKTGIAFQSSKFSSELRYNYNQAKFGIPEEIGDQTTNKTPELPSQKINNHIISYKNKFFFKNSSLDSKFGYTFNDRKEFEDEDGEEITALEMHLRTLSYDVKFNLPKSDKIEAIVGIQGIFQNNENFGEEALIPDAKVTDLGILATSHFHFNDKNDIQLGLRYDTRWIDTEERGIIDEEGYFAPFKNDFSSFNAALGYKYNLTKSFVSRINLASGFRAPNLAELTSNGVHEGTNRYEIGNNDLKNEQNLQFDLALEYKNKHIELFINGFYNKVNDYIFIAPNGMVIDDNPVYDYLQDDAKLYGGEFGFHLHPHPLDKLHLETTFETVTGKQDNGDYLPLIPANSLTNTLRMEFGDNTWLEGPYAFIKLRNVFEQDNISDFETTTDSYNLLSLGFGGNLQVIENTMRFNLNVNNLTNESYVNHLSRLKIDAIPNMGRSINISIKYDFDQTRS